MSSIEPLGGHTIVNGLLGGQPVKIRAGAHIVSAHDLGTHVTFDARRIHIFDAAGDRISIAG